MRILYYSWKAVSTMPFLVHRKQEIATEKKCYLFLIVEVL